MKNTIKTKKFWQIFGVAAVLINTFVFGFRPLFIFFLALGTFALIAAFYRFEKMAKVVKLMWHETLEAVNVSYVFLVAEFKVLRKQKVWVQGTAATVFLAMVIGSVWYKMSPDTQITTAEPEALGTLPFPIGIDRVTMTPEQLALRANKMVQTRQFYLLREDGAVEGARKVTGAEYQAAVSGAAAMYGIDPQILEAHLYLESYGVTTAKSPTGPKGPAQFTLLTAGNLWKVKGDQFLLRYKGQDADMAKKTRRTIKRPIRVEDIIEDNRENIELSVYAEAKLLKELKDFFGRQDFASAAYHSSQKDISDWVKMFLDPKPVTTGGKKDIEANALTYDKLYFGATPYRNPGTYQMYRDLMAVDFGANYWYKILCAKDLLAMYRTNKDAFKALADKQKYKGRRANNRMWTFYTPDDEKFVTINDLKSKLESGELVTVPNDPRFGFTLRWDEIGNLDLKNQDYYIATKRETAGALLFIAQEITKLRNGRANLALEVSSVSRTVDYQKKLTKVNPVATQEVSFHVLGLAFDIPYGKMSENDQRDVQFILDELDSTGYISWVKEKDSRAYHVVVAPEKDAIAFFQRVYDATGTYRMPSPLSVQ